MARVLRFVLLIPALFVVGCASSGNSHGPIAAARPDAATAVRAYEEAARQGNADAAYRLGLIYAYGHGVARDDALAAKWYRKAAEQGLANAQVRLGYLYEMGRGVARDDEQAVAWYRKAAAQGNAYAENNLGTMYWRGLGVTRDDAEAVQWYLKAAMHGNTLALDNLGVAYRDGRGVPRDDAEALKRFREAAGHGLAVSENNLGWMYAHGRGVTEDAAQAAQWYTKAAMQGYALAQDNLGLMYRNGRGVVRDDSQAVKWFEEAAAQRFARAEIDLGDMYASGRGVPFDDAKAGEWYRKAAAQGDARAAAILAHRAAAAEGQTPEEARLSREIATLVQAEERVLPAASAPDPERVGLARELIAINRVGETWSNGLPRIDERISPEEAAAIPPRMLTAIRITAKTVFQPDTLIATYEVKLAEGLDAATLRAGLDWERSDTARDIRRLTLAAGQPAQHAAMVDFQHHFVGKGGLIDTPRARECAQADVLAGTTEASLPLLEAGATLAVMIGVVAKRQPLDMNQIERAVVALRPVLRESARQGVLGECLFALQDLPESEFQKWLQFLRSDIGGRYERGSVEAVRSATLRQFEIFTRVSVEVIQGFAAGKES